MENLKLVSVRLDPRDVAALEEAASIERYYDRSDFIRAAVALMAKLCEERKHGKVLAFRPRWGDILDSFDISYHRGHE